LKIVKALKHITFEYDDDNKTFFVNKGYLSKVEAFSLVRFLIRIFQKSWYRRKK